MAPYTFCGGKWWQCPESEAGQPILQTSRGMIMENQIIVDLIECLRGCMEKIGQAKREERHQALKDGGHWNGPKVSDARADLETVVELFLGKLDSEGRCQ
jgi:hypothetical protein